MGKRYLIDTNTLIEFQTNKLPAKGHAFVSKTIDESFDISVINKIEILGYPSVTKKTRDFIALANVFELDSKVVDKTIELRKIHKIKIPDAIIAATAGADSRQAGQRAYCEQSQRKPVLCLPSESKAEKQRTGERQALRQPTSPATRLADGFRDGTVIETNGTGHDPVRGQSIRWDDWTSAAVRHVHSSWGIASDLNCAGVAIE